MVKNSENINIVILQSLIISGDPAKRQFDCFTCPGGFNCPQGNGTTTPIDCTKGWYSEPGQSICKVCEIGSVLNQIYNK